jgi:hypothetical protein
VMKIFIISSIVNYFKGERTGILSFRRRMTLLLQKVILRSKATKNLSRWAMKCQDSSLPLIVQHDGDKR